MGGQSHLTPFSCLLGSMDYLDVLQQLTNSGLKCLSAASVLNLDEES